MKRSVFLVGPPGAGKSTVGKALARLCDLSFVDSDNEIEDRCGVDIAYIFEKEGEEGFRKREAKMIDELTQRPRTLLATGGGSVMLEENRSVLGARGTVVYLYATVEHQLARTRHSEKRPLLNTGDKEAALRRLFAIRDPLYREVADLVVETKARQAKLVAREIYEQLVQGPLAGQAQSSHPS